MNGVYLTSDELGAMHGCGPLAACLYVWLRSWMDLRTGVVGVSRTISLAMLADYAETHTNRGAGYQVIKPSPKNVRTALDALARVGLVRRTGSEKLVFRMPMAQTLSLASDEPGTVRAGCEGTEPGTVSGTEPGTPADGRIASTDAGFDATRSTNPARNPAPNPARNPAGGKRANPAHIRDQSKPSLPQAAYTEVDAVGAPPVAEIAALGLAKRFEPDPPDEESARRATALAVAARKLGAQLHSHDPRVQRWVGQGVTERHVEEAVSIARQRRADEGSVQPIGAGYLDAILRDVLNPPKPKAPAWWSSVALMDAKAREIGIATARPGEELDAYRQRIQAAAAQAERRGAA